MKPDSKSKYVVKKSKYEFLMRSLWKETSEVLFPIFFTRCSGNFFNQMLCVNVSFYFLIGNRCRISDAKRSIVDG